MSRIWHRTVALVTLALLLAGCNPPPPAVRLVPTSAPFCAAVETICIDQEDRIGDKTSSKIEANNLGRDKVCKRKVECKQPKPTS